MSITPNVIIQETTQYSMYGKKRKLYTGAGVITLADKTMPIQVTNVDFKAEGIVLTGIVKDNTSIPPSDSNTIEDVIFNDPATIVFWKDGTKTVVKCQPGDEFDKEKGLLMAIAKKHFNNQANFNNVLKKFLPEEEPQAVFDGDKSVGEVIHIERTEDGIRALVKLVDNGAEAFRANPFAAIDQEAMMANISEILRKRGFNV